MNRFEVVDTYYWWLAEHHEGQWSEKYERLSKITKYYSPSRLAHGPENQDAYDTLCGREGCDHS